jgi:glutathione S-transferase
MPDGLSFGQGLLTLYCANKAYSPWSLRAWLALSLTGMPFGQIVIPLGEEDSEEAIRLHSPSGKLPALRHGDVLVWDSLAIFEYAAEAFPKVPLWPRDTAARAYARSICAEMHAGFPAIRRKLPFDIRADDGPQEVGHDVHDEIDRVAEIWRDCRRRYAGEGAFLFGEPSLADAMYAPMAVRFHTYGIDLDRDAAAYTATVWNWPEVQQWRNAALKEPWVKEEFEL